MTVQKDEQKEVATRVDGERRAAGPTGSTAASNEAVPTAERKMFCDCGQCEYWCLRGCLELVVSEGE